MEAWCRNQDLEWEGELLQGSELLFTDLHAAVQTPFLQNGDFFNHPLVSCSMTWSLINCLSLYNFTFCVNGVCSLPSSFFSSPFIPSLPILWNDILGKMDF